MQLNNITGMHIGHYNFYSLIMHNDACKRDYTYRTST